MVHHSQAELETDSHSLSLHIRIPVKVFDLCRVLSVEVQTFSECLSLATKRSWRRQSATKQDPGNRPGQNLSIMLLDGQPITIFT